MMDTYWSSMFPNILSMRINMVDHILNLTSNHRGTGTTYFSRAFWHSIERAMLKSPLTSYIDLYVGCNLHSMHTIIFLFLSWCKIMHLFVFVRYKYKILFRWRRISICISPFIGFSLYCFQVAANYVAMVPSGKIFDRYTWNEWL